MLRVLGKTLVVVSLLLCAATLLLWKAEPNWIGLGWVGQWELEIHAADGYVEFTSARNTTINRQYHGPAGQGFAFYRHTSAWGNPLLQPWHAGAAYIHTAAWYGYGSAEAGAGGLTPWVVWLALDARLLGLVFLFGPATRFFIRLWRRRPALHRTGAA